MWVSLKLYMHASTPTYPKKSKKHYRTKTYWDDIVITNAGKGGALVILDVKDYIKESERQLKTDNKVISRFKNDKLISNTVSHGWPKLKAESPRRPCLHKTKNT